MKTKAATAATLSVTTRPKEILGLSSKFFTPVVELRELQLRVAELEQTGMERGEMLDTSLGHVRERNVYRVFDSLLSSLFFCYTDIW